MAVREAGKHKFLLHFGNWTAIAAIRLELFIHSSEYALSYKQFLPGFCCQRSLLTTENHEQPITTQSFSIYCALYGFG